MCPFYNSTWFLVLFQFYFSLNYLLYWISDNGKTLSKELEFDIHFVSLNAPCDNNFVTL